MEAISDVVSGSVGDVWTSMVSELCSGSFAGGSDGLPVSVLAPHCCSLQVGLALGVPQHLSSEPVYRVL